MKDENYDQWLKGLKVGDPVMIAEQYISSTITISEVVKITPKRHHRVSGFEYIFIGGYVYNGNTSYRMLPPTDEHIEVVNLIRIRTELKSTDWSAIDDDVVRKVRELIRGEL